MGINITPAILTTDAADMAAIVQRYVQAGFTHIDIDVQEQPFVATPTLNFEDSLAVVLAANLPADISLGWDLKLGDPSAAVNKLRDTWPEERLRIYVYQQSELDFTVDQANLRLGLLEVDGVDFDADWYSVFPEVQVMSIDGALQGAQLDTQLLNKVNQLRDLRYTGDISIDGGVNLESAQVIKPFVQTHKLQRVSVGSYFQTCTSVADVKQALFNLEQILNS